MATAAPTRSGLWATSAVRCATSAARAAVGAASAMRCPPASSRCSAVAAPFGARCLGAVANCARDSVWAPFRAVAALCLVRRCSALSCVMCLPSLAHAVPSLCFGCRLLWQDLQRRLCVKHWWLLQWQVLAVHLQNIVCCVQWSTYPLTHSLISTHHFYCTTTHYSFTRSGLRES